MNIILDEEILQYLNCGFDILIGKTTDNKFKIELDCGDVYWQGVGDSLFEAKENLITNLNSIGSYNN